ncbi:2-succinyl-6-hydroxy-2,4-cyclohexadiene-1-carboxylate synthase [Halotia branconii]|uniref:Putative 2-succinyl-6-hydroxy-2,4-cyclohexadiene-1-carboxylate synthase n=1 Tax=Halotia branconii CENA392 TaxID=1539056 RepID=A0AAJ6NME6_9CYAN|nr:2-succinyl-6-hydroxy-2,4-cyclohexadiene-1-carboxylate synthase [Halotia branconii]WGV23200.1 2-succinyl-6-hydroxy-2,4-cyclohexadiene-1-carboxylate synthase [Halotia branconii CENA392]
MTQENYQFHYYLISKHGKPLIMFLHGFMGNINEFNEAIKLLDNNFSYLILDLPGHGKTQVIGSDEYYTMANIAHALINLLDELKIDKCFLIGYSMGGRLALYLILHFPERFYKVVLESASPGLMTAAEQLERVKSDAQIAKKLRRSLTTNDFYAFLLNWYSQPIFGSIKNHPQLDLMLESRLQNDPIKLAKSLQFMGTGSQPSLWEKLSENTKPLLLISGAYDQKFIDINTEMTKICKVAQLKIINDSAHNTHFENTWEFVENIKNFWFDKKTAPVNLC